MAYLNFEEEVTMVPLLNHMLGSGGSMRNENPYIIVPRSSLEKASSFTRNTIDHCISEGFILEVPFAKKASEYHITLKCLEFCIERKKHNSIYPKSRLLLGLKMSFLKGVK